MSPVNIFFPGGGGGHLFKTWLKALVAFHEAEERKIN
jgi:hypothetical protein